MASVLVIEDDAAIRSSLIDALASDGYAVTNAPDGMTGVQMAVGARPDIVILDLGLPDIDGHQVLSMVRSVSRVPVVVATARDDEAEIVRALDSGADDYLVKPFSTPQLLARVRAVLRRAQSETARAPLVIGDLVVSPATRKVTLRGAPLDLSRKEFDLLLLLAQRAGQVVPRADILAEVWRQAYPADRTVDVHVSWLRRKLGESAAAPVYLHSVRGVGLMLVAPESP